MDSPTDVDAADRLDAPRDLLVRARDLLGIRR